MIHKGQLKRLIDETLREYCLYSDNALELVYGTIIQESRRGTYIRQASKNFDIYKHAIGIAQCEFNTFSWLQKVYNNRFSLALIRFEELEYNLKYSILFCRLRYLIDPEPIPDTLEGQAKMWKRVYNSVLGKGTEEEYINNYNKYS